MTEKIYIGVAWPYANGSLHLGHIAGCYLPADIFARFNRMIGNDVLMVSGSDEHGTPITITAEKEGVTPKDIVDRYSKEHTENMIQFGISFDLFTRTTTRNHQDVVQDIFKTLYEKNHIYEKEIESFYCHQCNRFLPDRYIEGACPQCNHEHARGDQCDECGHLLDPQDLIEVRCKLCGSTPELRKTTHLFFALNHFESDLFKWMKDKTYWKSSVHKFTENWLKDGLHERAITRDINWGIPVPIKDYEEKRIYVWFDAVIGYLSASIEWSLQQSNQEKWKEWWYNPEAKHYYFLAKDNIPFHSIIWPSILMGYDKQLQLPYDIPANEYLRLQGQQFSKSKGLGIWVPDIIKSFDVDAIRYYLSINMPENKDANWLWDDFVVKNNDELVGTFGNFIHRVLTFTQKNYGIIPDAGQLDTIDTKAVKAISETLQNVNESLSQCQFKQGLKEVMNLAKIGNVYFNEKAPWQQIKNDDVACKTTLHVCLKIVKGLCISIAPFLPFTAEKIWKSLGETKPISHVSWNEATSPLHINYQIEKPKPLFTKLSLEEIMPEIDPFSKLDLRVAEILEVKDHPNADKLYLINIDIGALGKRELVAGLKKHYQPDELIGKKIIIVSNLEPATIRGVKSAGMLLAASDTKGIVSLLNPGEAKPGSIITIKEIPHMPLKVLPFDEFLQVKLTVDHLQKVVYDTNKKLISESGEITTDKPVEENAEIH
jgi:methionyl-tRNA synthetase